MSVPDLRRLPDDALTIYQVGGSLHALLQRLAHGLLKPGAYACPLCGGAGKIGESRPVMVADGGALKLCAPAMCLECSGSGTVRFWKHGRWAAVTHGGKSEMDSPSNPSWARFTVRGPRRGPWHRLVDLRKSEADIATEGTRSGRTVCSSPNFSNIPRASLAKLWNLPAEAMTVYARRGRQGLRELVAHELLEPGIYVCPVDRLQDQVTSTCRECEGTGSINLIKSGPWVAVLRGLTPVSADFAKGPDHQTSPPWGTPGFPAKDFPEHGGFTRGPWWRPA